MSPKAIVSATFHIELIGVEGNVEGTWVTPFRFA